MKDKLNNIFSDSECIAEETMYAYIENKLSSEQRRIVELHLASCELCSDALEGLSLVKDKDKIRKIVDDINEKITAKNPAVKPKSFWMNYRYSIAAALAFLVISGGAYIMITNNNNKNEKIFAEKFTPYPDKENKENSERTAAAPDEDKGPEGQTGKDSGNEKAAKLAPTEKHLDNLEQADIPNAIPLQQTIITGKDRWVANDKSEEKYNRTDTTVVNASIVSAGESLKDKDKSLQEVYTYKAPMSDSVSVVSGDQLKNVQSYDIQSQSVYRNTDIAVVGGTKADKQTRSKAKGTPAKADAGNTNQTFALSTPSNKKSENNKTQTTNVLPAPNMNTNGATTIDNNNNNVNLGAAQGGIGNTPYYISDNRTTMDTAMKKYEDKDYSGALISFDKVLNSDASNYNALFYAGVSYLSVNKTDSAIQCFDKVLKKKDGQFYEATQWYKALALIKQNDDKAAKKLLREIISNGGTYKSQANDTFNQLK